MNRAQRRAAQRAKARTERHPKIIEKVHYSYVSPWRVRTGLRYYARTLRDAGLSRPWFRFLVLRYTFTSYHHAGVIEHGGRMVAPLGRVWTRAQAQALIEQHRKG